MKKILLGLILILSLGAIGCNNQNKNIKLTNANNAEKVVKSEYSSRIQRLFKDTLSSDIDENKYTKIDRYKDFTEKLSTFRTNDDEFNFLHDKMIEVSLDIYNMRSKAKDLYYKYENLKDKDDETNEKKLEKLDKQIDELLLKVKNQEEHWDNIAKEMNKSLEIE